MNIFLQISLSHTKCLMKEVMPRSTRSRSSWRRKWRRERQSILSSGKVGISHLHDIGRVFYSCNITGYEDEAENTWEPVENLDCEDKIQEFEKKYKVSLNQHHTKSLFQSHIQSCFHILLLQERETQEKVDDCIPYSHYYLTSPSTYCH